MRFQEKPLTKSLQRGEDPHFDQVSLENNGQTLHLYSQFWQNDEIAGCVASCHCPHIMCCSIKRHEKLLSHPHTGLSVKDSDVYLERWLLLCVRCVQQVCSSTQKVLSQPQGCVCAAAWGHSSSSTELGFFSCPSGEWRPRCVPLPRPDSPPFLCAQPIPPIPSFSSLSPKPRETAPLAVSTVPV